MAEGGEEGSKTEEATPFKLSKAREKGSVARGIDLSFFASLAALAGFLAVAGAALVATMMQMMRTTLASGIARATDPAAAIEITAVAYRPLVKPVMLFGATVIAIVLLVEIVQLRGIVFSAHPLKPDFSKVNPAKGLKRMFSLRVVREAAKSIVKFACYAGVTWLAIRSAMRGAAAIDDAASLADALRTGAQRMIWWFVGLAFAIAALDQVIARRAFAKQMRMSRRDVTREAKDREGDPRLKRKRKQLHAEFAKANQGLGALPGSDMLIVNPEHVAVALAYDRSGGAAPVVRAKARDLHAHKMKRRARMLGIPIFERPALARALWADSEQGGEIAPHHYHAVAELYFKLDGAAVVPADEGSR